MTTLQEAAQRALEALKTCYDVDSYPANGETSQDRAIADLTAALASEPQAEPVAFQERVEPWLLACFGAEIAGDTVERNHRFLEESLELVQACGCTQSEAHQLVDYVFGRPVGEKQQEVGGVMVTLAALCLAQGLDMHQAGEAELARIWTKVEQIRAKQAAKPKHSPLPEVAPPVEQPGAVALSDIECPPDTDVVSRQLELDQKVNELFSKAMELALACGLRRPQSEKTQCANELKIALREALLASQTPGQWLPIASAKDGELLVACWIDACGNEQYEFDYLEDGCWSNWHDHAEHVEVIGGHGVSYTAPYTHWMPLPPPPAATQGAKT